MDLLELAFYLSVLSYCLGLALRALPLPFFTIKKLGKSLVAEGIFSCVLTFSYNILLSLLNFLSSLLGSDWAAYSTWMTDRISALMALIAVLKALSILLSKVGLSAFVQGFIGQITGLLTTSLTTLIATSIISSMISTIAPLLIALGIVLHAVPFRLTRSVGATLIAITMVFSICIPLMPAFINMFSSSSGLLVSLKETCTATITLVDLSGAPFGQAVIEGYSGEDLLYRYKFGENGVLVVDKASGFPCADHVVKVDVVGNKYTASLSLLNTHWNGTIQAPNLLAIAPNRFILFDYPGVPESVSRGNSGVTLTLDSGTSSYFKLYVETGDSFEVFVDYEPLSPINVEITTWYNIKYSIYTYEIPPGEHYVELTLHYSTTTPLEIDLYPYTLKVLNVDPLAPENLLFYVTQLFIELTVLPLIYIAVLATISLNVARLLGGAYVPLTKIVVSY